MKKRIICVFMLIFIIISFGLATKSYAIHLDPEETFDPDTYEKPVNMDEVNEAFDDTKKIAQYLIKTFIVLFQVIGVGIAIIMLLSIAAKFMWGSIEQKAEVKKHLFVYVVGAGVMFSAAILVGVLQNFIKDNI